MIIMSVDFGDARTGIAVCDKLEMLASPVTVIKEYNFDTCIQKVSLLAQELKAQEIIVGLPLNMNGTEGERAEKCKIFADKLSKEVTASVMLWDERSTTVLAHNYLNTTNTKGKKRKDVVDAVAAVIILENYLEYRKNHKN